MFGDFVGNPPVQFNGHESLLTTTTTPIVDLTDENSYTDVMTQYFYQTGVTEMIQLESDINDDNSDSDSDSDTSVCDKLNEELQGFTISPTTTIARTTTTVTTMVTTTTGDEIGNNDVVRYWIYSPAFNLLNNEVDTPLQDGGKAAVDLTKEPPPESFRKGKSLLQPKCSNVARNIFNEDSCQLADAAVDAAACSYDRDADINSSAGGKILVCGSPNEVANVHDLNSGPITKNGFNLNVGYNKTTTTKLFREQRYV